MTKIVAYNRNNRPLEVRQFQGEVKTFTVDYARLEAELGEAVSSVVWSGRINIENESLANQKATADISTTRIGWNQIKVEATLPSGVHISYFKVKVNDPQDGYGGYC